MVMEEKFKIIREDTNIGEKVTLIIPASIEAKERYWLNVYGIENFEIAEFNKITGQVVLKVSTYVDGVADGGK